MFAAGLALMGLFYGFISGRYRRDADVADGLAHLGRLVVLCLTVGFFASQMFACVDYSHLGDCLRVWTSFMGNGGQHFVALFLSYVPFLLAWGYYLHRSKG